MATKQQIWQRTTSGLTVPTGFVTDTSAANTETYLHIKEKGQQLEKLYADTGVGLSEKSDLAKLITDAKRLSDCWLTGQEIESPVLFNGAHLSRIADAVLPLRSVENRASYLQTLVSGNLRLLDRKRSKAKDVLWEIELWSTLVRHGFDAKLIEPPDIALTFENDLVGIACKKIYSEQNVSKVISEAVGQIEPHYKFGIVAINIDELTPANQFLDAPTIEKMSETLQSLNYRFLTTHSRHFKKYLSSGRVISALVTTNLVTGLKKGRPKFLNAKQTTIWSVPDLEPEKQETLTKIYQKLMKD